ncbi:MAG TPA: ATP-binding protein [Sulfurospirillum arcachonense]|nr:ATP-binding protein [Sulfurospirillum arcachonense]
MPYTRIIGSDINELGDASLWMDAHLPLSMTPQIKNNILLVAQELITNAIIHGNQSVKSKTIIIVLEHSDVDIMLSVEDQGKGIVNLPTKEESIQMDYLDENGRGLKLATLLSDSIVVKKNKIIVRFKK